MHTAPTSPLTTLAVALREASTLKGAAQVLAGADKLAVQGAPPRIVLFPLQGQYESATDNSALRDLELQIAARIWARDIDGAWDLQVRLLQALEEQGAAAGLYWRLGSCAWDTEPDTTRQGQELEVIFTVRLAVDRVATPTGKIDAVQYTKV